MLVPQSHSVMGQKAVRAAALQIRITVSKVTSMSWESVSCLQDDTSYHLTDSNTFGSTENANNEGEEEEIQAALSSSQSWPRGRGGLRCQQTALRAREQDSSRWSRLPQGHEDFPEHLQHSEHCSFDSTRTWGKILGAGLHSEFLDRSQNLGDPLSF